MKAAAKNDDLNLKHKDQAALVPPMSQAQQPQGGVAGEQLKQALLGKAEKEQQLKNQPPPQYQPPKYKKPRVVYNLDSSHINESSQQDQRGSVSRCCVALRNG